MTQKDNIVLMAMNFKYNPMASSWYKINVNKSVHISQYGDEFLLVVYVDYSIVDRKIYQTLGAAIDAAEKQLGETTND